MAVFAHFSIDVSHTAHARCAAFFFTVHAVDACAQPRNFATRHAGVRPVVLEVQLPAALRGAERLLAVVRGLRAEAGLPWLARHILKQHQRSQVDATAAEAIGIVVREPSTCDSPPEKGKAYTTEAGAAANVVGKPPTPEKQH